MDIRLEPEMISTKKMLVDYYCTTAATEDDGGYYELVLSSLDNPERAVLERYIKEGEGVKEAKTCFSVPYDAVTRCMRIINDNKLSGWNEAEGFCTDGFKQVCKFWDGEGYVRVSSDNMPINGVSVLNEICAVIEGYLREEYLMK